MLEKIKKFSWHGLINYIAYILVFFLVEYVLYEFTLESNLQHYWMLIPILICGIITLIGKIAGKRFFSTSFLSVANLLVLISLFIISRFGSVKYWLDENLELIAVVIISIFLINILIRKDIDNKANSSTSKEKSNELFNLFYINTSKAHEIAMLIDNKVMKAIEREQVSEELLKYSNSVSIGTADKLGAESGYTREESSKKRVYENFDVKTTKSIMLNTIYNKIRNTNTRKNKLKLGDLTVFENVELKQRNIDDTVFILNILQDSKMKSDTGENLEVNLNKMMDKMLDDFTIDYIFSSDKQGEENNYIVQLPYKAIENFENGYQHNDLQLGKLSLIGIYRGLINFSLKDSVSSKFLDLMSESYQNGLEQKGTPVMKSSNLDKKQMDIQFDFSHKKLTDKVHLIDVIAIIQELNIDREE